MIVLISSLTAGAIGCFALVGWLLNIRILKSFLPGLTTMKANTAVGLLLTAVSVWLSCTVTAHRKNFPWIAMLLAVVILTSMVTAAEYSFHWNAGIDELLFTDVESHNIVYLPGRFAPGTAACFLLLSGALLVLDARPRVSHGLTIGAILISLICLIGYVNKLPSMYGPGRYTSLALHTIFAFVALCMGVMACRPKRGLAALVSEPARHGVYPHSLLAGAVFLPMLLGSLALYVQRIGGYGPEFTFALFCVLLITLSVALVWVTEGERQRSEDKRLTTSQALSKSEERLRLALDAGRIGIWESNPVTQERRWDARCRQIFGFPPDLIIDADAILSCVHPEDRDLIRKSVQQYVDPAGSGCFDIEHRVYAWQDGSLRYVYGQGRTLFEGKGANRRAVRSIGTLQDVTSLKQGEKDLRRLNQELEQIAYAAAHDLQEPLRNVCLATQVLAQRYKGRFDNAADALLQTAADSPLRMQAMVKDLLAYSRALNTEELAFSPVDSNVVLGQALENLRTSIEEKQAQISFDKLPSVRMRQSHLLQLFQNLIGNSLKYSGEEVPRIHVSCQERDGSSIFLVKDNGMGIPLEFHERAFLVFKRLHGSNLPGTGIGLALCKRIIEFYGGTIWIESEEHSGSTFLFTPPLASEKVKAEV